MSTTSGGPNNVNNGLILHLDAANRNNYSQNAYPFPLDIFAYVGSTANSAIITRDSTIDASPADGIPIKMAITGNDPYIASYNSTAYSFATVSSGQTWTVSCYVKASTSTSAGFYIFGANSSGGYVELTGDLFSVTTSWQRISKTFTFTNASTVAIQVRLEGVDSGGIGINVWFDGMQVERGSTLTTFNPTYNQNLTTINDLSRNQNNVSLINGPTFSDGNCGSILTDGIDDYLQTPYISNLNTSGTIELIYKQNNVSSGYGPLWRDDWRERIFPTSINIINSNGTYYYLNGPDNTTNIVNICYSYNGTSAKSYKNGVLQSNITMDGLMDTRSSYFSLAFQCGGSSCVYTNCNFYSFKIYNRQLSDSEVLQNYNAQKSRFGLP
jgi:hypothetical protein